MAMPAMEYYVQWPVLTKHSYCIETAINNYQEISSRYTTSTRGLSQIHEAMLDNPEGVARGIIKHC